MAHLLPRDISIALSVFVEHRPDRTAVRTPTDPIVEGDGALTIAVSYDDCCRTDLWRHLGCPDCRWFAIAVAGQASVGCRDSRRLLQPRPAGLPAPCDAVGRELRRCGARGYGSRVLLIWRRSSTTVTKSGVFASRDRSTPPSSKWSCPVHIRPASPGARSRVRLAGSEVTPRRPGRYARA
jgi:hypothetical protein